MQTSVAFILVVVGALGTWLGAEMLVRGATRIAFRLGVRPMVVGMTVVALGTSAPEAVSSLTAARLGSGGLALGNVLGSNIANIGLILGILGLMRPIQVSWALVRSEIRILVAVTCLGVALALFPRGFSVLDGVILLAGLGLFCWYYLRSDHAVSETPLSGQEITREGGVVFPLSMVLLGLVFLVGGAAALVNGARTVALRMGIDESVVGATLVAVGTSLPELAASIVAVLRGQHEIGVGNILGSNILNLLFVLGISATFGGHFIPYDSKSTGFLLFVMVFFTLAVIPILHRHGRVERPEAAALLLLYIAFSIYVYRF